ncbi:glycine--tRNA ligase [Candidatus Saccharibacteria bacterium]|nr:glycine--tRNA ligase [Candidatus Saccharibacteria bacterium]
MASDTFEKVVALCKRRGFVYPGSDIYGGLKGFWDYGPLGVELKNNIKRAWWQDTVYARDDVIGVDAAIIMNPKVWKASGHTEAFTDPLVECKKCHKRFRADQKEEINGHERKEHGGKGDWTEPKRFNLLTEVYLGTTEPKQKAYLRGEVTQGVFVNFQNIVSSARVKIPFGVAQIGKAFRNEITPGNFTYRSREFEQMELEFFINPDKKEAERIFKYWKKERFDWYVGLGMDKAKLRFREHGDDERAHYARAAEDIEYKAPFGWSEFEGIHDRGDWDLSRHNLTYKDPDGDEEYIPWVIETSGGVDRSAFFFLLDGYHEDRDRVVLKLHPRLAPYKVAVFPLVANKPELVKKAREIYDSLKGSFPITWDERGNIGKRYFAQDETGTPWCVTTDYQTLEDNTVTVRDRDTTKQKRVKLEELADYFRDNLS